MINKIWICGSGGRLGTALNSKLKDINYEVLNTDKNELDICDLEAVCNFGELNRPDIIINTASISPISKCEENQEEAFRTNAIGARNLGIVASKLNAKLVQLSTDDVFDGTKGFPYIEFDMPNPCSIYGKSRLAGEKYIKEFTHHHFIIRSSWIYGNGNSLVDTFVKQIRNGEKINAIENHYGSPTYANDLADFIIDIMQTNEYGTYHAVNRGCVSQYQLAKKISEILEIEADIHPIEAEDLKIVNNYTYNTSLDNGIIRLTGLKNFDTWDVALKRYLKEV